MNKRVIAAAVTGLMMLAVSGLTAERTREQAPPQTPGQTASPAQEQAVKPAAEQKTEQEKAQDKDAKKKAREAKKKEKGPAKPKAEPEAKPAVARTAGFTVAVRGGYFAPSEAAFKDVYGGGPAFGAEITARVWKGLSAWIEGGVFSKTGKLTYTGETTKVRITPFGLGLDYGLGRGRLRAYAGAGLSYYDFRETNVIGDVSSGGLGWKARAGAMFRFWKRLFADVRLSFSHGDIEPSGIKVNIGGLELGLGLGYLF
jgi:hypothetical protein